MKTFRLALTLVVALAATSLTLARNLYGYIGFGYGVAPVVPCTVELIGNGQHRVTTAYYHPFGLTKMRYHFNGIPTPATYRIQVFPQALYRPGAVSFHMPNGWFDFKAPDVWLRP